MPSRTDTSLLSRLQCHVTPISLETIILCPPISLGSLKVALVNSRVTSFRSICSRILF